MPGVSETSYHCVNDIRGNRVGNVLARKRAVEAKGKRSMKKENPKVEEAVTIIQGKMQEYLITPRAPMERERYFHTVLAGVSSDLDVDRMEVRKKFGKNLRF